MRIVIPGGSGQVGTLLGRAFHAAGDDVVVLSRRPVPQPWRVVAWDGQTAAAWWKDLDGADVVINLAGRSVNCRYSEANRAEILESRLPVRLEKFSIRQGSGGKGAHDGGDGVVREVTFLEPMRANILANRRRVPPRGLNGGGDAKPGRNWVERTDGSVEELTATDWADVDIGDRFVIETPGGGGFGREGA